MDHERSILLLLFLFLTAGFASACDPNPCLNDGFCLANGTATRCFCPIPNITGEFCDKVQTRMTQPMGMKSGAIVDSQLASSSFQPNHETRSIRLGVGPGWIPNENDSDPWIGVTFLETVYVMGIVIDGKFNSMSLSYSDVGSPDKSTVTLEKWFVDPNPDSQRKRNLIVGFDEPLVTDSIKLHQMSANVPVNLTMEILGYISPIVCDVNHCQNGGICLRFGVETECLCPINAKGVLCEHDLTSTTKPLGMKSGANLDSQLSASSFSNLSSTEQTWFMIGFGWIPDPNDEIPWFKVNLMRLTVIMGAEISGNFGSFLMKLVSAENPQERNYTYFFENPAPERSLNDRLLRGVFAEGVLTTFITIYPEPGYFINFTVEILGYYRASPIDIICLRNCLDLVTPSKLLGIRASYNTSRLFGDNPKTYEWTMDIMDASTREYQMVEDLSTMTSTGINRDAIALKEHILLSGRSYRLNVKVFINGESDIILEERVFNFRTNRPPSLGEIVITPTSGFAMTSTFILSCISTAEGPSDLIYQYSTRYGGQHVGNEKQLTESDSCQQVILDLPVGKITDNFTLEVVVRVYDVYGGYAEGVYTVQVKIPLITNDTAFVSYLESNSGDVTDKLQSLNVLLSIANAYSQSNKEFSDNTNNDTTTEEDRADSLATRIQLRSTLIALLNEFAQDVNTTADAKLLLAGMQYATEILDEVAITSMLSLIPSLNIAIELLYDVGITSEINNGTESGSGHSSVDKTVFGNVTTYGNDTGASNGTGDGMETEPGTETDDGSDGSASLSNTVNLYNRQFSYNVLDLLHTVNLLVLDIDKSDGCGTSRQEPPTTKAPNNIANTKEEIIYTVAEVNEILEYLESLVITNVLLTIWPGESLQVHKTVFADLIFYTTSGSDRDNSGQSQGDFHSDTIKIPTVFLSASQSDNVLGSSIIIRNRNPYPDGSCSLSPVQVLEVRNERGMIIPIKDAQADIEMGFQRSAVVEAEKEKEAFPSNVDMIRIKIQLTEPGAFAAEINIGSEKQRDTCIHVSSRKSAKPTLTRWNEHRMFHADGNQHVFLFNDVSIYESDAPSVHYLGIKVVQCAMNNITNDLVMTSPKVENTDTKPLNVTFGTRVHRCSYWNKIMKDWSGKGCKVSQKSTPHNTVCTCNHMTSFASSFYVPVNKIDFAYVFANANLAENHTVFTTVMCILVLYLLLLIWLRKKDKDDLLKWSAHPLVDNVHGTGYFYTVSVHTGFATNAGTRSTVRFDMVGDRGSTGQRLLSDTDGLLHHDDGALNHYVLKLPRSIGKLKSLLIWHDDSGKATFASWYLDWVMIVDLQTGQKWAFICGEWLASNKGECKIFRSLKPASQEDAANIQADFFRILRGTFADDNLWVSLFTRPTPSSFSRVQRLSVCLTFLFLFMITNAMFYRTDDEKDEMQSGGSWHLGPFEIDHQQLYIGTISILIIMPVNFMLVALFKSVQMSYEGHESLAVITGGSFKESLKRSCRAPPIMKYVAWSLVFISIVLSAFFVIMYSLMWGPEKSQSWLMSMLTSFLESLLIFEPLKAFGAAFIILMIIKHKKKGKFYEPEAVVYQDELEASGGASGKSARNPSSTVVEQSEAWQQKSSTATLSRQILSHIAFVTITIIIILQHRDVDSFYMTKIVNQVFQGAEGEFAEVRTADAFWKWTSDILIPAIFPKDTLPIIDEDRIVERATMFLTGPVRFRQLRLEADAVCGNMAHANQLGVHCVPSYNHKVEEQGQFGVGWSNRTNTSCPTLGDKYCAWTYYSSYALTNPSFYGRTGTKYAGGGFVAQWDFSEENSSSLIKYLTETNWLDEYTQAVFVEFTLYNANVNLFSYVTYLLEFTPVGNVEPHPVVQTFRLYDYTSDEDIAAITITGTYVLFVLTLLYFVIREIDDMKRSGKNYLLSVTNWLELCIIISSVTTLLAYMARKVIAETTGNLLQDAGETGAYVNFHPMAVMDEVYSIFLGFVGFLSTLKINVLLSFDKRFTQFKRTMVYATDDLLAFGIYFGIILFAFVTVNALVQGGEIEDYNGIVKTLETLVVLLLGQFRVHRQSTSMQWFNITFFILYCILVGFILCRVFVAIVCDAFSQIRKEDVTAQDGIALEKVIGAELKRYFKEFFPFKGKRSDAYKFKPTDKLSTVRIDVTKTKEAWGGIYDAPPLTSKTHPPAYSVYDPLESDYVTDLRMESSSPDTQGVDLMIARAMESLNKMSKTIENI